MEKTAELYMRDRDQVRGPLEGRIIAKMINSGQIPPHFKFSFDKRNWMSINELKQKITDLTAAAPVTAEAAGPTHRQVSEPSGESEEIAMLMPKVIKSSADTESIKRVLKQSRRAAKRLKWLFMPLLGCTFAFCTLTFCLLATLLVSVFFPQLPLIACMITAVLPAGLLAATLSHFAGNGLIRILSGFNHHDRLSLALHLPWNRAPKDWPRAFRRWIYCGDWLIEDFSGDLTPYIRAFVTGEAIDNAEQELAVWNELMQATARGKEILNWETGHSVRELAKVDSLPVWVRDIAPGMSLYDMEKSLGTAGHAWAVNLLKRAAMRKKSFGKIDFSGDLHEAMFEFHYCRLSAGREGLLVIIRPHNRDANAFLGESLSDSAAA